MRADSTFLSLSLELTFLGSHFRLREVAQSPRYTSPTLEVSYRGAGCGSTVMHKRF
jgi:hypothetical protein